MDQTVREAASDAVAARLPRPDRELCGSIPMMTVTGVPFCPAMGLGLFYPACATAARRFAAIFNDNRISEGFAIALGRVGTVLLPRLPCERQWMLPTKHQVGCMRPADKSLSAQNGDPRHQSAPPPKRRRFDSHRASIAALSGQFRGQSVPRGA
ncbi:hypothetical protein ACFXG4_51660 [Nocardia sp. NPDC059246]|uniref:hypothetical protein n=1 Tax=unclassified Nocardia TaxID=2637762 RepID=UPI0036BCEBBF